MIKYGIYYSGHQGNGWCGGYWGNPKSRIDDKCFVSDINDAYIELNEWISRNGNMYEVREVK